MQKNSANHPGLPTPKIRKVKRRIQKEKVDLGKIPMIKGDNRFNGSFFKGIQQAMIISNSLLNQRNSSPKSLKIHPHKKKIEIVTRFL